MSAEVFGSGNVPQKSDTMRMLLVKDVNAILNPGGGGGGGASGGVYAGNYSGGQPPFTPPLGAGIATDTSTGRQWNFYSGVWV